MQISFIKVRLKTEKCWSCFQFSLYVKVRINYCLHVYRWIFFAQNCSLVTRKKRPTRRSEWWDLKMKNSDRKQLKLSQTDFRSPMQVEQVSCNNNMQHKGTGNSQILNWLSTLRQSPIVPICGHLQEKFNQISCTSLNQLMICRINKGERAKQTIESMNALAWRPCSL